MTIKSTPIYFLGAALVLSCICLLSSTAAGQASDDVDVTSMTGWVASTADELKASGTFIVTRGFDRDMPAHLVLERYLPPVGYQGRQNSCVPWSVAYYAYTYGVASHLKWSPLAVESDRYRFSPAFLYHLCNHGKDTGVSFKAAFDALKTAGCASYADMPYNVDDVASPPSARAKAEAETYRARHVGVLFSNYTADPGKLRTFLHDTGQPFSIGFTLYSDFPLTRVDSDYIYDHNGPATDPGLGGHAVTVVGYDQDKHAFLIVNSWGRHWGQNGFLWVSEHFIKNYAREGWAVSPPDAAPVSSTPGPGQREGRLWKWTAAVYWAPPMAGHDK